MIIKNLENLYFENNQETLLFKIDSLEKKLTPLKKKIKDISTKLNIT